MMIRTAPKFQFSARGVATLTIAIIGLSAATVAAAMSADSSEDVAGVMHRAQTQSTVRGFEGLMGALGAKPEAVFAVPAADTFPVAKPIRTNAPIKLRSTLGA
jgi:TPP-dependent pyruvate/acetoin dehydrogenase alpha subunit